MPPAAHPLCQLLERGGDLRPARQHQRQSGNTAASTHSTGGLSRPYGEGLGYTVTPPVSQEGRQLPCCVSGSVSGSLMMREWLNEAAGKMHFDGIALLPTTSPQRTSSRPVTCLPQQLSLQMLQLHRAGAEGREMEWWVAVSCVNPTPTPNEPPDGPGWKVEGKGVEGEGLAGHQDCVHCA